MLPIVIKDKTGQKNELSAGGNQVKIDETLETLLSMKVLIKSGVLECRDVFPSSAACRRWRRAGDSKWGQHNFPMRVK